MGASRPPRDVATEKEGITSKERKFRANSLWKFKYPDSHPARISDY